MFHSELLTAVLLFGPWLVLVARLLRAFSLASKYAGRTGSGWPR